MPYLIRPAGSGYGSITEVAESALPQVISGLAPGSYNVGRVLWNATALTVVPVPVAAVLHAKGATAFAFNSTTLSVGWGTHETGDLGLLFLMQQQSTGRNEDLSAQGWTILTSVGGASNSHRRITIFWRRAASNAEPAVSIPISGSASRAAVIYTIKGAIATGTPAVVLGSATQNSATPRTLPGGNLVNSDSLIFQAVVCMQAANAGDILTFTPSAQLPGLAKETFVGGSTQPGALYVLRDTRGPTGTIADGTFDLTGDTTASSSRVTIAVLKA